MQTQIVIYWTSRLTRGRLSYNKYWKSNENQTKYIKHLKTVPQRKAVINLIRSDYRLQCTA